MTAQEEALKSQEEVGVLAKTLKLDPAQREAAEEVGPNKSDQNEDPAVEKPEGIRRQSIHCFREVDKEGNKGNDTFTPFVHYMHMWFMILPQRCTALQRGRISKKESGFDTVSCCS